MADIAMERSTDISMERTKTEVLSFPDIVFNNMIDVLLVMGVDARIVMINRSAEEVLGYKEEELIGAPLGKILGEDDIELFEMIKGIMAHGFIKNLVVTYIRKDGEKFPADFTGSAMRDGEGKLIGIVGIIRDLKDTVQLNADLHEALDDAENKSEQIAELYNEVEIANLTLADKNRALEDAKKNLEKKVRERTADLNNAKEMIEEAYRDLKDAQSHLLQSEKMASVGQLAAGVAHEINNPIGFINSNLNSLEGYVGDMRELIEKNRLLVEKNRGGDLSDLRDAIEDIERYMDEADLDFILEDFSDIVEESKEGTTRVKKIVQDLKNFSHVDEAERTVSDINSGIKSTLNIVNNEIKYKATVKMELGDIPELECYPQQLNQVFMNLLVNASQAIEDKGEIGIKTFLDGDRIVVQVSDSGCGIPKEKIEKIFEPFFTTKPVGEGTGLGLSMSYNIIKNHCGDITVDSEPGKGTTFTIELPIKGNGCLC